MSEKVKACPFCGHRAKLLINHDSPRFMCFNCGAVVKFLDRSDQPWKTESADNTVAMWNRRDNFGD